MAAAHGHILIVEDDNTNRMMLGYGLAAEGHSHAEAANGREALERLRAEAFDVVLLDIVMPELDGYEVLSHMKHDASLRDIPVIVISAADDIASIVKCIEMGAEDYLPKPFDPVLLRARLGASLEKKRLRDQEIEYLRNVHHVIDAAAAVESGAFELDSLDGVAQRGDALGNLARVFQRMAREVYSREQRLRQQIAELRIELDTSRVARQVQEITETDYFKELEQRADELRMKADESEQADMGNG